MQGWHQTVSSAEGESAAAASRAMYVLALARGQPGWAAWSPCEAAAYIRWVAPAVRLGGWAQRCAAEVVALRGLAPCSWECDWSQMDA